MNGKGVYSVSVSRGNGRLGEDERMLHLNLTLI